MNYTDEFTAGPLTTEAALRVAVAMLREVQDGNTYTPFAWHSRMNELDAAIMRSREAFLAPSKRDKPCSDCSNGYCTMNCGPAGKVPP